jgi:predicted nucleic acid-binding protein
VTTDLLRPSYIVDTSVVLKWFVQSGESDWQQARELRAAYVQKRCTLKCPEYLVLELTNALKTGRRFSSAEIKLIAESFRALKVLLEPLRWSTLERAVDLADSLDAAVYDSYFLASAIASGAILVTADELFLRKVGVHPNLTSLRHLNLEAATEQLS